MRAFLPALVVTITAALTTHPSARADVGLADAVSSGDTAHVASILARNPKLANKAQSVARWRPLHVAVVGRQPDMVVLLLDHGADANGQDSDGATPLHFTVGTRADSAGTQEVRLAMARALISHGADVMAMDSWGATPLHWAAMHGDSACVELLIAAGARVNQPAKREGWVPLHGAAGEGHLGAVRVLLRHGADSTLRDGEGRTPLDLARRSGYVEIAELLGDRSGVEP